MNTDRDIERAQSFLMHWQKVTSRPMTTREVEFANAVRNEALEQAAQKAFGWNTAMTDILAGEIRNINEQQRKNWG